MPAMSHNLLDFSTAATDIADWLIENCNND